MFNLILKHLKYYWRSTSAVILILVMIGIAFIYTVQTTDRMTIQASGHLTDQWRTGYDLLVSPRGSDLVTEDDVLGDRLVRRSDLANHGKGISLEQYEVIKSIEGIQVAAPLSFIGYVEDDGFTIDYGIEDYGFYVREDSLQVYDGINYRHVTDEFTSNGLVYQYMSGEDIDAVFDKTEEMAQTGWINTAAGLISRLRASGVTWSLVAIDPEQESQLLNMDQAIVYGHYFDSDIGIQKKQGVPVVPLILLNQSYDARFSTNVYHISVSDADDIDTLLDKGGGDYLKTLPKKLLHEITFNPFDDDYMFYFDDVVIENNTIKKRSYGEDSFTANEEYFVYDYDPIQYQQKTYNLDRNIPVVEALPQSILNEQINYRTSSHERVEQEISFDVIGRFDTELLQNTHTTSDEPLPPDYYKPEDVYITHDVKGTPYAEPKLYQHSPFKSAYHTGGIDALTTLGAAELFLGDRPISMIRIIVDGVGERNEANMAKVERVAQDIQEQTGLHVDVMLGAADRKVHVLLDDYEGINGYGYLLEGWSEEGTSFIIEDRVSGTTLLLTIFIVAMGLICISLVYRQYTENRKRDLIVQHTFGWSKDAIFRILLIESLTILLFVMICLIGLSFILKPDIHLAQFFLAIGSSVVLAVIVFINLYIVPILNGIGRHTHLRGAGSRQTMLLSRRPGQTLGAYIVRNVLRHPFRNIAKLLIITVTFVYVVLFYMTTQHASSVLSVTFLGEAIDTSLAGHQWVLFVLGLVLALVSYIAIHIHQTEHRSRDIQLFQAWGWRPKRWVSLYVLEESLIASLSIGIGYLMSYYVLSHVFADMPLSILITSVLMVGSFVLTLVISASTLLIRSRTFQLREF